MTTRTAPSPIPAGERAPAPRFRGDNRSRLEPLPNPPKKPDAMKQMPHISRAYLILEDHFHSRPDVLVGGDGYLCYDPRDRSDYVRPDCLVAFGVSPDAIRARNGYVIGEVGQPPDFVLEVASESTGHLDCTVKRDIYAEIGIDEYWRFDPTGGEYHDRPLAGDRLVNGAYAPIELSADADGMIRGHSSALGLDLCWDRGWLRFYDPVAGEYLPDLAEAKAQRDAAAEARAAAAEARAATAEAEAKTLRERLRRLLG